MIRRRHAATAIALAALAGPVVRAQAPLPVADALAPWLARRGVGLAAARVGSGGIEFCFAGTRGAPGNDEAPDADTLFEIGSISKTFTALLLADAVVRGEVGLDNPAETWLPEGTRLRDTQGAPIRLLDLATHRSGLPRSPTTPAWYDRVDPFARYGAADLTRYLSTWTAEVPRDSRYGYSNLGLGLLGWLLAERARQPFADLLRERVLVPLGLSDVHVGLPASERERMSQPHRADGSPAPRVDFGVLAPAAGLVASPAALARYARAALGLVDGEPLAAAFALCLRPHAAGPEPRVEVGLAWLVSEFGGRLVYRHDGSMPGHTASLLLHPAQRRGALVLSNARVPVDDLAWHLLDPRVPLRR